jgi:transglutaminase-like putative cysteine protease
MQSRSLIFSVFSFALMAFSGTVSAQDGWNDIRENDNKTARTHFESTLKTDSANRDALQGMIFLSELEGDDLSYKKYVNTLINNYWKEQDYELYSSMYNLKSDKDLLSKNSISDRLKLGTRMSNIYEIQEKGQKDQAYKEFRKITHDFNWSVIGPFKNLSGSGYAIEFPVEKAAYDESALYPDDDDLPVHWQECKTRNPNGFISFDYNLPSSKSAVYYANTFINNPTSRIVQVRVARSAPLKIWIDDDLVFKSDEDIVWGYDNEYVQLTLPAGIHRLMLKTSNQNESFNFSGLFDNYDRQNQFTSSAFRSSNMDYSSILGKYGYLFNSQNSNTPIIRFTDTSGNLLTDISSSFTGTYKKQHYDVKLTDKQLIRYYEQEVAKNPTNLYNYYALTLAYINGSVSEDGEEFFVKIQRAHPNSVYFKYLASKMYEQNGKMEKFYEVLNGIDQNKTPVYALLYQKFKEKDRKTDEDEWLAALKTIYAVSPSNYDLIMAYLKYYDDKGMKKEKEDFAKEITDKYPDYKEAIDQFMKDDGSDKEDYNYGNNDKSRFGNAMNDLFSSEGEYQKLARYKKKGNIKKVCQIYDKRFEEQPYSIDNLYDKASYLKEKKKYDAAIVDLHRALTINSYSEKVYELLGDIYKEKEVKDSAIYYYKKAKYYTAAGTSIEDIDDKMEKVQEQKSLKKMFDTKKFDDILADTAWQNKYTDEESAVLLYTRDVVLDEYNQVHLYSKIMVKILKDPGVLKWTEFNFSFLGKVKAAKVIKENGAEIIPDMQGGYAVFKDLRPGDIIQIEGGYTWRPESELDNQLTMNNFFTFDAPVYYTKFEVAVPHGKKLNYLLHKMENKVQQASKDGYDFYRWEYHDTHKMEHEDASLDDYDQYGTIMVSTMMDWSTVVQWYHDKTYKKLDATYEVKEVLDSIIQPGMSQQDKVKAIYNYLTKDIKYSYVPFMQSGQIPKRCGLTLASRIGDCKDVATVMVSMLRQEGIEAYYTLVKTNFYDHFKYLPSQYFDHVIAGYYIDGKLHFADMTTDYYPHYVLTEADANAYALLIKDGTTELMQLPQDDLDPNKNNVEMNINATLLSDRSIKIDVKANHPGMAGGMIREKFARYTRDQQKNLILDMMGKGVFQNIELKDYHIDNISEITAPLKSNYEMEAGSFCDKVAGLLIFKVPYMTAIQQSQAMLSKTRYNRLNVKALSSTAPTMQKIDIHFPAGWQLIELPENVKISGKYGEFKITYKRIPNGVHVEKYQQFNEDEVPVEEYNDFKSYYFKVLEADGTRMALQRVKK